jgi:hypothetical protein
MKKSSKSGASVTNNKLGQSKARPSVILEYLSIAHVTAQGIHGTVAAHVYHLEDRGAAFGGRCEAARPQGMASE